MTITPSDDRPLVAIVAGGSRGLGLEIARRLATDSAAVVIAGRSRDRLELARAQVAAGGRDVRAVVSDMSTPTGAQQLADAVAPFAAHHRLVFVYAAGVFGPVSAIVDTDPDEWRRVVDTNLLGAYYCTRLLLPAMLAAGWGRIIYLSSRAAVGRAAGGGSAYSVSKLAVNRLAEEVAAEVAGTGVTVNSMHPGDVATDMWAHIKNRAAVAGQPGAHLARWADTVGAGGGDDPTLAPDMVDWLVDRPDINGAFILPEHWQSRGQEPSTSWS